MKDNICYLCGSNSSIKRMGIVRDNPNLEVLECNNCTLVYLSSYNHINEMYYVESGMHGSEILPVEEWLKNTAKDDERRFKILESKLVNQKLLDFGCGNGGFLLKANNSTKMAEGVELEKRLKDHFIKNNLNVWENLDEVLNLGHKFNVITAFHVIEHLKNPIEIIQKLYTLLEKNGELIIEVPSSNDALLTLYQSKEFSNFTYWSNHIYLFNASTIEKLVRKSNLKLNWIKQIQRYPLSNHLYWLSKGKPGGHKNWSFLDDIQLNSLYESILSSLGLCDTLIFSITQDS